MRRLKSRRLSDLLSKFRNDQRGNVLAITGAGLVLLTGGAGFSIDVAQWYLWQRELQMGADAAALSGAYTLVQGKTTDTVRTRAQGSLQQNVQVATLLNSGTVAVVNWGTGASNAVQVTAQARRSLPFTSLFLDTAPTITATATAAVVNDGEWCMLATNKTAQYAVDVGGNALLNLGCGIAANSNNADAIRVYGSAQVTATTIMAVGGVEAGANNITSTTEIIPNASSQIDPFAGLAAPANGPARTYDKNQPVLEPGTYSNLDIKADHTFNPGVYVIDGGSLSLNSNNSISGTGVLFVLKNDATIKINGGADVNLTAPSSSQISAWGLDSKFTGVLIFQDSATSTDSETSTLNGNATLHLGGAIYLPTQEIQINGNASPSTQCLLLVADTIDISGNPIMPNSCPLNQTPGVQYSLRRVRLVA